MKPIDRYIKYKNYRFDDIIKEIKYGRIKCGRYVNNIKIDDKFKIPNTLFDDRR